MLERLIQTDGGNAPIRRDGYIRDLDQVPNIPPLERARLKQVARRYAFRANAYYLNLINWHDSADPIRRIIIPCPEELHNWGSLDASNERSVTVARGLQHKYPHTVLLLCNEACGGCCRYCFRKRLFTNGNHEATVDVSESLAYIAGNPNITNVLLSGGDPLAMSTRRLVEIIEGLRAIDHVGIIRIGSKMPAFNPRRILDDPELQQSLAEHSTPRKRIYLMAHFDHPRELTDLAVEGIDCLLSNGVICANQCPLIKGVNDDPETLATLFRRLSFIGCPPYYVFQGRPTAGNEPYRVPIVCGWQIFNQALGRVSGLACRARFVMSHETGKTEVLAVDQRCIYLRYHRAKEPADRSQFLICRRNDEAYWLDDLDVHFPSTWSVDRDSAQTGRLTPDCS